MWSSFKVWLPVQTNLNRPRKKKYQKKLIRQVSTTVIPFATVQGFKQFQQLMELHCTISSTPSQFIRSYLHKLSIHCSTSYKASFTLHNVVQNSKPPPPRHNILPSDQKTYASILRSPLMPDHFVLTDAVGQMNFYF